MRTTATHKNYNPNSSATTRSWRAVEESLPNVVGKKKIDTVKELKRVGLVFSALREREKSEPSLLDRAIDERKAELRAYERVSYAMRELEVSVRDLASTLESGAPALTNMSVGMHSPSVTRRTKVSLRTSPQEDVVSRAYGAGRLHYVKGKFPLELALQHALPEFEAAYAILRAEFDAQAPKVRRGAPSKRTTDLLVLTLSKIWTEHTGSPAHKDRRWPLFAISVWDAISPEKCPSDLTNKLRDAQHKYEDQTLLDDKSLYQGFELPKGNKELPRVAKNDS
ncbi:MAG: hypothetical protein EOP09_09475 [Proteobacteria bacterium]|nr:MAG: hypothetical protein EOP09_09475 [Pseudomonadota bacterium]